MSEPSNTPSETPTSKGEHLVGGEMAREMLGLPTIVHRDGNPFSQLATSDPEADSSDVGAADAMDNPFAALAGDDPLDAGAADEPATSATATGFQTHLQSSAPVQPSHPLAGFFVGEMDKAPATLILEVEDGQVTGALGRGGFVFVLQGSATESSGAGRLVDQFGGEVSFRLSPAQGGVYLFLAAASPGQEGAVERRFDFRRGTRAEAGVDEIIQRDALLVGHWRHTDAAGPATTDTWFRLFEDGSFRYGDFRMVDRPMDTSESTVGTWRTEAGVLYLKPAGMIEWTRSARYLVDAQVLRLQFEDGSTMMWERGG